MELELAGKTALVTGASKGIGYAIAEALAAEGVNIHIASRSRESLEAARDKIRGRYNVNVEIHPTDLSERGACEALAEAAGGSDGRLDILVNNAGAVPAGNIEKIDEDTWRKAWDLKVFGYINMTRAVYPAMVEKGEGVIMNIVGIAAIRPGFDYPCGATGNAGLNAFTKAVASNSLDKGVRVLGINPGHVETERLQRQQRLKAREQLGDEEKWQDMLTALPQGRAAKPEEIADVAVFLCSKRAYWVNGIMVDVDGGHHLRA